MGFWQGGCKADCGWTSDRTLAKVVLPTGRTKKLENATNPLRIIAFTAIPGLICSLGSSPKFPPANRGKVGHIAVYWVEPEHRMSGIATELVNTALELVS